MKISDYVESQIKGLWGTDFDENGIPVIKTNNLTYEGHIDYSDICKRNITREHAKECYLKPGDLLIEKSGGTKTHSVGYVSYFEGDENKFVCNNFILALRLKNTINSKFLFYQIQFKYESNQFSDCFNKTTGIQNLKVKDYLAKEIKIYSPEEQEKIVKELDTVRSTINKNKQILEKYDFLIKSRFIEMFGDPVQNSMGWEVKKLGKMCSAIMNGTTPKGGEQVYVENGITFLRSQNVWRNKIDLDDVAYIDEATHKSMKKSSLKKYDILMTKTGRINTENSSLGRAALFLGEDDSANINGHVYLIRLEKEYNHEFVIRILTSPEYRDYIRSICVGGIDKRQVNKDHIEEFPIIQPPKELQDEYSTFVQQIDKSKFEIANSLKRLYNKGMLS